LAIALCGAFVWDGQAIGEHGFFQGYNAVVFATVCVQAAGGLIVAMVIKYADNILKGFATSLSIILSTVASIFIFNFVPTIYFLFGSILVFLATYLYSMPDAPKAVEITAAEPSEKNPVLIVEDYDLEKGLGLKNIPRPFRDESDPESGDEGSQDSISVYQHDDGTHSRNFSPSLIGIASMEKQVLPELGHVA